MPNLNKDRLIRSLINDGYLREPRIIEAFEKIDRKDFVPENLLAEAYGNYPLPIGFGQTISQPLTVAFMFELLEPKPGEKILDVGSGSGWTTALLAYIVGDQGKVIGIERIPELKEMAERNVAKYNLLEKGVAFIICGDGSTGYKPEAPFDKIIAAAAAAEEVPQVWKEQLKINGRIVAPVGQSIVSLDKISTNQFSQKQYFGFSFVPLVAD